MICRHKNKQLNILNINSVQSNFNYLNSAWNVCHVCIAYSAALQYHTPINTAYRLELMHFIWDLESQPSVPMINKY